MFFFVVFLFISILGFIFGVRALLIPDSWPFNLNKRELDHTDLISIRFRGIFLACALYRLLYSFSQTTIYKLN
jgi:hypothetical protein